MNISSPCTAYLAMIRFNIILPRNEKMLRDRKRPRTHKETAWQGMRKTNISLLKECGDLTSLIK